MKIKANSVTDLEILASYIRNIPKEDRCQLAAVIVHLGLMKSPLPEVQRSIELMKETGGVKALEYFFQFLSIVDPKTLDTTLADTIKHLTEGNDIEDIDSVGGWSQREINLLLNNYQFEVA